MIRWSLVLFLLAVAIWEAPRVLAQITLTGVGSAGTGGGPPPPACAQGKLDFSGNCNTVYAVIGPGVL